MDLEVVWGTMEDDQAAIADLEDSHNYQVFKANGTYFLSK